MADRNSDYRNDRRPRWNSQQGDRGETYGQQEQFENGNRQEDDNYYSQQGETGWRQDADRYYGGQGYNRPSGNAGYRSNSAGEQSSGYDRTSEQGRGFGSDFDAIGYRGQGRSYGAFTGNDFGGRDFSGNSSQWGNYRRGGIGAAPSSSYRDDERGFLEKAGDEVASWFGDDEAARRREADHRGRGPGNYTRSDQRILEDVCDRITDDWRVDGTNIQVTVDNGELTLDGTVTSRDQKRRAEDCADSVSGVKHVQNNLRIQREAEVEKGSGPFI